jgi:hypothetical protein
MLVSQMSLQTQESSNLTKKEELKPTNVNATQRDQRQFAATTYLATSFDDFDMHVITILRNKRSEKLWRYAYSNLPAFL